MTQTDDTQKARSKTPESSTRRLVVKRPRWMRGAFLPEHFYCRRLRTRPRLRIRELRRGKNAGIIRLTFPKRHANVSDRLARAIREIL